MKGIKLIKYPVLLCLMLSWTGFFAFGQKVHKMEKIKIAKVAYVVFERDVPDMSRQRRLALLPSETAHILLRPLSR